jgi:hypothetical protein
MCLVFFSTGSRKVQREPSSLMLLLAPNRYLSVYASAVVFDLSQVSIARFSGSKMAKTVILAVILLLLPVGIIKMLPDIIR